MCRVSNSVKSGLINVLDGLEAEIGKKCPDQKVATIKFNGSEFEFGENFILKEERKANEKKVEIKKIKQIKRIVVILESPHNDEFNAEITGPALGRTGINFERDFIELFNDLHLNRPNKIVKCEHEIIFMNAIQYKTSLGGDTEIFRDRVWLTLWSDKYVRQNFKKRIEGYKPDIVINLCTIGSHKEDLILPEDHITYSFIKSLDLGIIEKKTNILTQRGVILNDNYNSKKE